MAGHHSNWFKLAKGPLKGTRVFISNATLASKYPGAQDQSIAGKKALLAGQIAKVLPGVAGHLLTTWAGQSTQPGGQALKKPTGSYTTARRITAVPKPPEDEQKPPKPAPVTVTQANGKQKVKDGLQQGDLAVVTSPYGHSVIHVPSGQALLYVNGNKHTIVDPKTGKSKIQNAPDNESQAQALAIMATLNKSGASWGRDHAEALSSKAQAAIQASLGGKVSASKVTFTANGKGPEAPKAMPQPTTPDAKARQDTQTAQIANTAPTPVSVPASAPAYTPSGTFVQGSFRPAGTKPNLPSTPGEVIDGLIVHKSLNGPGYTVSHIGTGYSLYDGIKTKGEAKVAAIAASKVLDFTQPGDPSKTSAYQRGKAELLTIKSTVQNGGFKGITGVPKAKAAPGSTPKPKTPKQNLGTFDLAGSGPTKIISQHGDFAVTAKGTGSNLHYVVNTKTNEVTGAWKSKAQAVNSADVQNQLNKQFTPPPAAPSANANAPVVGKHISVTFDDGSGEVAKVMHVAGDYFATEELYLKGGQHAVVHAPTGKVVDTFFSAGNATLATDNYAKGQGDTPFAPQNAPAAPTQTGPVTSTSSHTVATTAGMSAEDLNKPLVTKPLTIQTKAGPTTIDAQYQGNLAVHLNKESTFSVVGAQHGKPLLKFKTEQEAIDAMRKLNSSGVDWGQHDAAGWNDATKLHFKELANSFGPAAHIPAAHEQAIKIVPPKPKPQASIIGQGMVDAAPGAVAFDIAPAWEGYHDPTGNQDKNAKSSKVLGDAYKPFNAALNGKSAWTTDHEMKAVNQYQDGTYTTINKSLWSSGSEQAAASTRAYVDGLDTIMEKSAAPFAFTATRAQYQGHELYNSMAKIQVGGTWTPQGFESASVDSTKNTWGGGKVRVHYRVPKGVTGVGIHLNSLPNSIYPSEVEYLVNRRTQWRAVAKTVDPDGNIDVVMQYVGREKTQPGVWTYDPTDGVTNP